MQQQMLQNINVNSILYLVLFIAIFGCKKQSESTMVIATESVVGLLSDADTTMNYDIGLRKLSDYNFFKQPLSKLEPSNSKVIPYEMNAPLFTDYASKKRFIALPDISQIAYTDSGVLQFPKGTILIKNFYYQDVELETESTDILLETRLLISDKITGKWTALPYIWNESQTEAYLYILGKDIELNINIAGDTNRNLPFTYSVPNSNMCKNCHMKNMEIVPLGPTARQLNRAHLFEEGNTNQLLHLKEKNMLNGLATTSAIPKIPSYEDPEASVNDRARAYLDVNCAHCHQDGGSAKTSGLHLTYEETDMYRLGLNKPPVAAGQGSGNLSFGIVAGKPEASILLYRMKHLEPDIVMPEIGKNTLHLEGISLIEDWIASLDQ